jgi:hypothetical protein
MMARIADGRPGVRSMEWVHLRPPLLGALAVLVLATVGAHAGTPRDVSDLVGARASVGERALRERGYRFVTSRTHDRRVWANWWRGSDRRCIAVLTRKDRYEEIESAAAADCRHDGAGDHGSRPPGYGGRMNADGTLGCESTAGKYRYCPRPAGSVGPIRLLPERSSAECSRGGAWGNDDDGAWVDKGCRGVFQVRH